MRRLLSIWIAALAIGVLANWGASRVPRQVPALPQLSSDPKQSAVVENVRQFKISGHEYRIQPRFQYELYGLVVSYHDSNSFWDISHASWGDHLNSKDICVVWGQNMNVDLSKFNFWSGDWTCYFQTKDSSALKAFNLDQISNNHLLPANPAVAKLIAEARIGDQIKIRGQLVDYAIDGLGMRMTSTVRTDREDGACEIVYVTDFAILARENGLWIRLASISWAVFALASIALLAGFFTTLSKPLSVD